jgi:hypothetical protein
MSGFVFIFLKLLYVNFNKNSKQQNHWCSGAKVTFHWVTPFQEALAFGMLTSDYEPDER